MGFPFLYDCKAIFGVRRPCAAWVLCPVLYFRYRDLFLSSFTSLFQLEKNRVLRQRDPATAGMLAVLYLMYSACSVVEQ